MDQEVTPAGSGQGEGSSADGAQSPDYAGFETPEQLVEGYTSLNEQHSALSEQVKNLEQLKGRQGSELGQLRQDLARTQGMMEAAMKQAPQQQQGPSIADVQNALRNGEIDEGQAMQQVAEIASNQTLSVAEKKFQKAMTDFQSNMEMKSYVSEFIRDNPGYKEAHDQGRLQPWLDKGMKGEEAWANFQLTQTREELASLKKQADEATQKAEQEGLKKGAQLEQGKTNAGKVLGGQQQSFQQEAQGPVSREQRKNGALDTLRKMRTG